MKHKILLVDDDEIILKQLSSAFSGLADIFLATTGQTALAMARDLEPSLILLDLGLPDIDGYDVMSTIKNDDALSHIPLIVITSRSKHSDFEQSMAGGASEFLIKPLDNHFIRTRAEALLKDVEHLKTASSPDKSMSTERFTNLVSMLSEAVIITDSDGTIELVNQFCLNLFGYEKQELIGQNVKILTPPEIAKHHDHYVQTYNKTREAHLIGNPREMAAITKSGKELFIELNLSEYAEGGVRHYLGVIRDITEKKLVQAKLLKAAMYDHLTGLNTNLALTLDLEKITSTETKQGYIYSLLLDVDDFQSLNAVVGMEVCDELLKSIAHILSHLSVTYNCRAYRLMSDRFLVYGCDEDEDRAVKHKEVLLDAINRAMNELYVTLAYSSTVTTVCLVSSLASSQVLDLKHQLELVLRTARKNGKKGQTVRASEGGYQHGLEFAALKLGLQSEVYYSELSVVLQPKVDMSGQVCSFEALLRWNNSSFEHLYLGDYIEAAEVTSAIIDIGYFVIEEVCKFLFGIPLEHRKRVFINLSIRQVSATNLLQRIQEISTRYGVSAEHLGFEITESMVATDIEIVKERLFDMQQAGYVISIDDFGTGQSNLRYLHKLPISELKIDKSFVDDVEDGYGHYPLVEGIFHLAKSINLKVIAEGVEKKEQVIYLNRLGVDEIQGYYFYRPMSIEACEELLLTAPSPIENKLG